MYRFKASAATISWFMGVFVYTSPPCAAIIDLTRVKFGPLGWNVVYNFGDSDLDTAFKLLGRFADDLYAVSSTASLSKLPVDSLVHVTGNITYGGWVTDEWDRRCLLAVLDHFYCASIFGDAVSKSCLEQPTLIP